MTPRFFWFSASFISKTSNLWILSTGNKFWNEITWEQTKLRRCRFEGLSVILRATSMQNFKPITQIETELQRCENCASFSNSEGRRALCVHNDRNSSCASFSNCASFGARPLETAQFWGHALLCITYSLQATRACLPLSLSTSQLEIALCLIIIWIRTTPK